MPTTTQFEGMFTLAWQDWGKALVMAVLAAILTALYTAFTNNLAVDWTSVWHLALVTGITYLIKNVLSNNQGQFLGAIG